MGISNLLTGIAVLVAGIAVVCNLPPSYNPLMTAAQKATLKYLADAKLQTIESNPKQFLGKDLWEKKGAVIMAVRRPGCSLCREEAAELSSLKPKLDALGVDLYSVVHETLGVPEFKPYFKGPVYLDKERRFYGPVERRMLVTGFLRISVWRNFISNWRNGVEGNLEGEGSILGSVFVIGPGKQGILFEHREKEFGDYANLTEVLNAVNQIRS
ncbi:hypothetical protein SNE40_018971 [Patella caerulea]|uniref:Peroxiredoxin-like 2A n=1 Tax=Patella caerulea TaxID=87958 RepID=A0AAN8J7R6_PATCE